MSGGKALGRVVAIALALLSFPVDAAPLDLHRGVGLHEWLNWSPLDASGAYRWPPYRSLPEWQARYRPLTDWPAGDSLAQIHALGFDFVRLTVDPGPLLLRPEQRRETIALLLRDVALLRDAGLKVVVNFHPVGQVPGDGADQMDGPEESAGLADYRAMLAQFAEALSALGTDWVALEPYNEPAHYPCDGGSDGAWPRIMAETVRDIRVTAPDLTLIATGACGGSIDGLLQLDAGFDDPNLLYSFHMYEPHLFTHQRGSDADQFASGLPWPNTNGSPERALEALRRHMEAAGLSIDDQQRKLAAVQPLATRYFSETWDEARLKARIGEAVTWATSHGIPAKRLFLGEFGVLAEDAEGRRGAAEPDRLRYLAAVRQTAEAAGMAWSVWEYSNPWGMSVIAPEGPAVPDQAMLKALGLVP